MVCLSKYSFLDFLDAEGLFWKKGKLLTKQAYSDFIDQSHDDDERRVRRREKNRVAAQRSRKKQTQKADKLHEVTGALVFFKINN